MTDRIGVSSTFLWADLRVNNFLIAQFICLWPGSAIKLRSIRADWLMWEKLEPSPRWYIGRQQAMHAHINMQLTRNYLYFHLLYVSHEFYVITATFDGSELCCCGIAWIFGIHLNNRTDWPPFFFVVVICIFVGFFLSFSIEESCYDIYFVRYAVDVVVVDDGERANGFYGADNFYDIYLNIIFLFEYSTDNLTSF